MQPTEQDLGLELNNGIIEGLLRTSELSFDAIPVDPFRYKNLFASEVMIRGRLVMAVYKACRPEAGTITTKLSFIDKETYQDESYRDRMGFRSPRNPISNPMSYDDSDLLDGELAFRYLNINLKSDPIEIRSRIEVSTELRGKGLGKTLFDSYESLARDAASRTGEMIGKKLQLIIRDDSDPKGWTESHALKNGFKEYKRSDNMFKSFQKVI